MNEIVGSLNLPVGRQVSLKGDFKETIILNNAF